MKNPVSTVKIKRFTGNLSKEVNDLLAVEEPLEIRLKFYDGISRREKKLAVTMRTPGYDFELAVGFLITEGIVNSYSEIERIFYCEDVKAEEEGNVLVVSLNEQCRLPESVFNRNFYLNSSCGVCGKSSIDSIETICNTKFDTENPKVQIDLLHRIPELAREDQSVFKYTGGLHASALFDLEGNILLIREDIGRHNALDKLIGARAIKNESNDNSILFVSGRAGFELVQKSVVAGIPIMISVGAPSSLAVGLALKFKQTLIGFARNNKFNVYTGSDRVLK